MNPAPSLSIALATFNGAAYLDAQLASLAAQSLQPAELVVTDDGSSDATLAILRAFQGAAPFPVRIYAGSDRRDAAASCPAPERELWLARLDADGRLGYADNFLLCAYLCGSDLVAFCDQDDLWLPEKNRRSVAAFADPAVGLVSCSGAVIDGAGRLRGARLPDYPRDANLPPLSIWPWQNIVGFSQTFRRDLLSAVPADQRPPDHMTDGVIAHDRWTFFLNHALHRTVLLSETLVHHRRHDANTTGDWQAPSLASTTALVAGTGADTYAKLAACAEGRAAVLDRARHVRSRFDRELAAASRYYRDLGGKLLQRSRLYRRSTGVAGRLRVFTGLVRQGGYRPRAEGGFGRNALLKDTIACLSNRWTKA